ncbi:MAG: hypothetical protein WCI36_05380 [bacterium]
MEIYFSILAVAFLALLVVNFYLFAKVKSISKKFKDLNSRMTTIGGDIEFVKGVELDFSVLEDKCKDEIEQMQIQVETIFNKVTEEIDNHGKTIEELETKIEELEKLEEQMKDEIEAKIDEKLEELDEKNKK